MENTANRITLTGTLASLPEYSHQNHERKFFRFLLSVDRLSGTEDLLPVLAAEDVLARADLFAGERFTIEGQIRSFNNREPVGRRLILCVYALSLTTTQEPRQYIIRSLGNIRLTVSRQTKADCKRYLELFDLAMGIIESPYYQELDPDIP